MFESPVTDLAQADPADLADPDLAPIEADVSWIETASSSEHLTAAPFDVDATTAAIAARRADLGKEKLRSMLWVIEPFIAYVAGGLLFLMLGVAGMFLPLFGVGPDGEIVGASWAGPLLIIGAMAAGTLTMSRRRRQAAALAGTPIPVPHHMSARQAGVLIGVSLFILILLGAASLLGSASSLTPPA